MITSRLKAGRSRSLLGLKYIFISFFLSFVFKCQEHEQILFRFLGRHLSTCRQLEQNPTKPTAKQN